MKQLKSKWLGLLKLAESTKSGSGTFGTEAAKETREIAGIFGDSTSVGNQNDDQDIRGVDIPSISTRISLAQNIEGIDTRSGDKSAESLTIKDESRSAACEDEQDLEAIYNGVMEFDNRQFLPNELDFLHRNAPRLYRLYMDGRRRLRDEYDRIVAGQAAEPEFRDRLNAFVAVVQECRSAYEQYLEPKIEAGLVEFWESEVDETGRLQTVPWRWDMLHGRSEAEEEE